MSDEPKRRSSSEWVDTIVWTTLLGILALMLFAALLAMAWLLFGKQIGPAWQAIIRGGYFP